MTAQATWRPSGWAPVATPPTEPAATPPPPDSPVVTEAPYLIQGFAQRWHPEYGIGLAPVRVAYAVADAWGWAVMARRGHRIVTVARSDRPDPAEARARAVQLVEHQAANWRRPT